MRWHRLSCSAHDSKFFEPLSIHDGIFEINRPRPLESISYIFTHSVRRYRYRRIDTAFIPKLPTFLSQTRYRDARFQKPVFNYSPYCHTSINTLTAPLYEHSLLPHTERGLAEPCGSSITQFSTPRHAITFAEMAAAAT